MIDPGPGCLVTNIPLGGKPETGAAAGDGKVYVNIVDNGEVVEIDARTLKVTRRRPPLVPGSFMMMVVERSAKKP